MHVFRVARTGLSGHSYVFSVKKGRKQKWFEHKHTHTIKYLYTLNMKWKRQTRLHTAEKEAEEQEVEDETMGKRTGRSRLCTLE